MSSDRMMAVRGLLIADLLLLAGIAVLVLPADIQLMLGFAIVGMACLAGCIFLIAAVLHDIREAGDHRDR